MAKSQTDALFERLHANGLRKRVARDLSAALSKGNGTRAGQAANATIGELRKLVAELEDRAKGGPAQRRAAAQKAAATRKREASKRSAAAKKAAQTRAKNGRSGTTRSTGTRSRSTTTRAKSKA
jgi:hypothetical protein